VNELICLNDRSAIGKSRPAYIIAEMSANHGGDFHRAVEIIHAAKEAGADCIKIQTYTADTLTINSDKPWFTIKKSAWAGQNLYDLYKNAFMPWNWQAKLKEEAEKIGLDFFSTAYDKSAVDFLEDIGVSFYKIASFGLVDIPLLEYVSKTQKPILMSTGMATLSEISDAVNTIYRSGNEQLCLLKCSSSYPAVAEDMNLKTMKHLEMMYNIPVGFSDHSLNSISAITAVALGAKVIEKHMCLSRDITTADSGFSLEPTEFKQMVNDIRTAESAIGKVSYELSEREKISRQFRKSIFIVKDIKAGETISEEHIRVIRPANGLKSKYFNRIIGEAITQDVEKGMPMKWEYLNVDCVEELLDD